MYTDDLFYFSNKPTMLGKYKDNFSSKMADRKLSRKNKMGLLFPWAWEVEEFGTQETVVPSCQ